MGIFYLNLLKERTLSSPLLRLLLTVTAVLGFVSTPAHADSHGLYELRVYTANEGKIEDLNNRFRNHTMGIFEKHGMKNIAYWIAADDPNKLVYIIAHKDADAAKSGWQAFVNDPE